MRPVKAKKKSAVLFCPRCDDWVRPIRPNPVYKVYAVIWTMITALLLVLFPFVAADFCVMLPSCLLIASAGGTIYRLSREPPECPVCSLHLSEKSNEHSGLFRK